MGKAVIVISSDLPEVRSVRDRIQVARLRRIVAELTAAEAAGDKHAAIH